jgi:hypothetical protein
LPGVGDRDVHWDVGFGDVATQRDDLLLVVVRIDLEWACLVEITKVVQDDVRADEKGVRRNPDEGPYRSNVVPILGIDETL